LPLKFCLKLFAEFGYGLFWIVGLGGLGIALAFEVVNVGWMLELLAA
jgi:hypothetical protein